MRPVSFQEMKSIQLEIMDDVHRFCLANNIRYSLGGGTLLGAIRHHGYIPWDDDIDINMPREDYERFILSYRSEKNEVLDLRQSRNCVELCVKICRKGTKMTDIGLGRTLWGINIDLFPIDGCPDNFKDHCDRILSLRKKLSQICPYYQVVRKSDKVKWLLKYIVKRILYFYPYGVLHLKKVIDQTSSQYPLQRGKLGGGILGGYAHKEVMPAETFLSYEDIAFEGRYYRTISDPGTYLRSLYGDYMTPPPKEKQIPHHHYEAFFE